MKFIIEFEDGSRVPLGFKGSENVKEAYEYFENTIKRQKRLHKEGGLPCPNFPRKLFVEQLVEIADSTEVVS